MHAFLTKVVIDNLKTRFARHSNNECMQPGSQVLYCICKLQINGIARYYVSREETFINLNMIVNRSIVNRLSWKMILNGEEW